MLLFVKEFFVFAIATARGDIVANVAVAIAVIIAGILRILKYFTLFKMYLYVDDKRVI